MNHYTDVNRVKVADLHLWLRDLVRHPEGEVRLYVGRRLISGTSASQVTAAIADALADVDEEKFCGVCFAGTESSEHHETCVRPLRDAEELLASQQAQADIYVVHGPGGFTEAFTATQIDLLERIGLIRHERDGHVMEDGQGRGVGPLHRFYREAVS